jgi:hypothetical protein
MVESLFGAEMPLAVRFFVAFLIVLGLIGAIAWAVRRFGSGRLGTSARGRQPRLAVIDYASVDGRRRLILVRRDNVEHLLMIGGPSDIVVEPNIVRAIPPARDIARGPAGIEALTRPTAIPLPESSASWPLQPETNGASRPGARTEQHEEATGRPQPQIANRQRDTLAALADELSIRATPPARGRADSPRQEVRPEARQEARADGRSESRDSRPEPRFEPRKPATPPVIAAPPPAAGAAASAAETPPGNADQSLADMAQRLEAALRKPPEARPAGSQARAASPAEPASRGESLPASPPPPTRPARAAERRAAAAEATNPNQNKAAVYDTLEQEMANLLGRPAKG